MKSRAKVASEGDVVDSPGDTFRGINRAIGDHYASSGK